MTSITDPARELGEIAERLTTGSTQTGDVFLADKFGVPRWSTDFVKVIACILERADLVTGIIARSDMDPDHKQSAVDDLEALKQGFTGNSLVQRWDQSGLGFIRDHGKTIKFMSQTVRREVRYPKLTPEEVTEQIKLIDTYLKVLEKSDEGPDFVRQGIRDGLVAYRFQLEKIGWMGAGYALTAFREVMLAYEFAQQEFHQTGNPDASAVLKGLLNIIKTMKTKVDAAKSWTDAGEAIWKVYQIGSSVATPLLLTGTIHPPTLT